MLKHQKDIKEEDRLIKKIENPIFLLKTNHVQFLCQLSSTCVNRRIKLDQKLYLFSLFLETIWIN